MSKKNKDPQELNINAPEMADIQKQMEKQKDFQDRTAAASVEITQILKRYEIDIQCEARLGTITISIPVSFSDKKDYDKPTVNPEVTPVTLP